MNDRIAASNPVIPLIACGLTGLAGGTVLMLAVHATFVTGPLLGALYGVLFALTFSNRAVNQGAGLLWGLAYALLLWLAVVTGAQIIAANLLTSFRTQRDNFPDLAGYLLCFGVPLGLVLGTLGWLRHRATSPHLSLPRAILGGALAGIGGGWVFGRWMEQINLYQEIAGLIGSSASLAGETLHYLFAALVGVGFALLFQRDVRGLGSSMAWGMAYGILLWFLGPLTILPLGLSKPLDWSYIHATAEFGSLLANIINGLIIGLLYAVIDRAAVRLLTESDPFTASRKDPARASFESSNGAQRPVSPVACSTWPS